MLLNCGVGEDSWESLGLQGDPTSPFWRRSALGFLWKYWCWSWNSNTLATWCEELTHWKRPWCWERLKAGGEGDDRGWDGLMASPTQWTWVWVNSGSWWWKGGLACCGPWGLRESDTPEWLNWTECTVKGCVWNRGKCFFTHHHNTPDWRFLKSLLMSSVEYFQHQRHKPTSVILTISTTAGNNSKSSSSDSEQN